MGRLAVTGAGGFIGRAVCRAAFQSGHEVVAIGPGSAGADPRLRSHPEWIADPADLAPMLDGVDVLIHAAGRGTPATVRSLASPAAQNELEVAAAVLDAAAHAAVGRVVLVSSGGTIYGDVPSTLPITEAQPVAPASPYAAVKAAIEQLGLAMDRSGRLRCVVARLSNPYGPFQYPWRGQGLVGSVFAQLSRGEAVELWGDGRTVRDYIYVVDAARGLLAAATQPGRSIFHISSGRGVATAQVIEDAARAFGVCALVSHRPDRDAGVSRSVLSSARLTACTGWRPVVDWREGLLKTAAWWAEPARLQLAPVSRGQSYRSAHVL